MSTHKSLLLLLCIGLMAVGCGKGRLSSEPRDVSTDTIVNFTVRPSDSWRSIAEDFFGSGFNAQRIAADNGFSLGDPPPVGEQLEIRIAPAELAAVRRLADAREPYNAGVSHLAAERHQEAAAAFEEALSRAPEFVDARYNLGLVLLKLGRPDEAAQALAPVVELRIADKDARYALASAYFHLGDYERSLPELEAALALDPSFLRARFTQALALERMGQSQRSRAAWRAYLELDDSSAWAKEARSHLDSLP